MASEFSKNCTTDSLNYLATYNLVCFALNSHTSIHINYNKLCIYARLHIAGGIDGFLCWNVHVPFIN